MHLPGWGSGSRLGERVAYSGASGRRCIACIGSRGGHRCVGRGQGRRRRVRRSGDLPGALHGLLQGLRLAELRDHGGQSGVARPGQLQGAPGGSVGGLGQAVMMGGGPHVLHSDDAVARQVLL